jgi:H+-transporting ATPase
MPEQHAPFHDIEVGDINLEIEPNIPLEDGAANEYTTLVRYISAYRDPKKQYQEDEEDGVDATNPNTIPWYTPWRRLTKRKLLKVNFTVPDDWLKTDIKTGLRTADADTRRHRVGWNEITTESENLFLKFISYFTGPILYGTELQNNI